MKRYHTLLVIAALGLLPASCGPEGLQDTVRETVSFVVTAATAPSTKATFYDTDNLPASLGLLPYTREEGSTSWALYPSGGVTPLVRDGRDPGVTSGKWIPAPESRLLWPREGYIRFFAYAPYVGGSADPVSVTTTPYPPTLSYTVPANVSAQRDLLVTAAESTKEYNGDPGWRSIDVPLRLAHALTGVRFRIIDGLAVSALSVSGVYGAGTLDLTDASAWSPSGGAAASYVVADGTAAHPALSPGSGLHADTDYALADYYIVDEALVLLLLPQALPSGASVAATVTLADGSGTPRTITADLSGQEWKPGTMVTYTITRRGPAVPADLDVNLLEEVLWSDEVGVAAWDEVLWDRQRVLAPDIERVHWH